MTDLFDQKLAKIYQEQAPLADRIRPKSLTEFIGQKEILGPDKPLRRLILKGEIGSIIFWGPPGCGKTTLARLIAKYTKSHFIQFSAVTSGVKEVKKATIEAQDRLKYKQIRTILFVDEIHRFNKAQQDAFLPWVENGTIILIGATTENPSFEIISPLLSRSQVFVLKPLTSAQVKKICLKALHDARGLKNFSVKIKKEALDFITQKSAGDARTALNSLEIAARAKKVNNSIRQINLKDAQEAMQKKNAYYDKKGNYHYDTISAFIKSIRGSDPDAALFWLARMLEAGEDARFIARRLLILASEDIGNADPHSLMIATSAAQAVELVGLPEAQLNLAQAVTYLASAPKSNASYLALLQAKKDAKNFNNTPVPIHLRNAPTELMQSLNYGKDYKYAHNYPKHHIKQQYLPDKLKSRQYYKPTDIGFEAKIKENLESKNRG